MVLERENWVIMPRDTVEVISFAGLVGDGAPVLVPSDVDSTRARVHHSDRSATMVDNVHKKSGFSHWLKNGNPFVQKLGHTSRESHTSSLINGAISGEFDGISPRKSDPSDVNGTRSVLEEENEDLLADFIDEDSQLPSRISKPKHLRSNSNGNNDENTAYTGSSICLLRLNKYFSIHNRRFFLFHKTFFCIHMF